MKPFVRHQGVAAPLLRINIDTDAIIPSREMKTVGKRGLAAGLFAGWRYRDAVARTPNPDFVLNQPAYRDTTILLAGANFGCGSSREHAVWALVEYGIRAIIAPSFGSIFFANCIRNGLLPIVLTAPQIQQLAADCSKDPAQQTLLIDLPRRQVQSSGGHRFEFELASAQQQMLIHGLDGIALTQRLSDEIDCFIARDRQQRPWLYPREP